MARIHDDITATIGNTPLVRLNRLAADLGARVVVKVESFNPLSSIKELVGRLYAEQRLAHTRRFALHPAAGNRKEAILDLELVLFDLAEGGKEKNRRNG